MSIFESKDIVYEIVDYLENNDIILFVNSNNYNLIIKDLLTFKFRKDSDNFQCDIDKNILVWFQNKNKYLVDYLELLEDSLYLKFVYKYIDLIGFYGDNYFFDYMKNRKDNILKKNKIIIGKGLIKYISIYENIDMCIKYKNIDILKNIFNDDQKRYHRFENINTLLTKKNNDTNFIAQYNKKKIDVLFYKELYLCCKELKIELIDYIFNLLNEFLSYKISYFINIDKFIDFIIEEGLLMENPFEIFKFDSYLTIYESIGFDYIIKLWENGYITFVVSLTANQGFTIGALAPTRISGSSVELPKKDVMNKFEKDLFVYEEEYMNNKNNKHYRNIEKNDRIKINKHIDIKKELMIYMSKKFGKINLPFKSYKDFKYFNEYYDFIFQIMWNLDYLDYFLENYYQDLENIKVDIKYKDIQLDIKNRAYDFLKFNFGELNNFDDLFKIENLLDFILIRIIEYLISYYKNRKYLEEEYPLKEIFDLFNKHGYKKLDYKSSYFIYQIYYLSIDEHNLGINSTLTFGKCYEVLEFYKNKLNLKLEPLLCEFASHMNDIHFLQNLHNLSCPWNEYILYNASKYGYIDILKYGYENKAPFNKDVCLKLLDKYLLENTKYEHLNDKKSFEILIFMKENNIISEEEYNNIVKIE